MTGEARAEWNRIVPDLLRTGVFAAVDRGAVIAHCDAWQAFVESIKQLNQQIKKLGYVKAFRVGLVSGRAKARAEYLKAAQQLGLTPAARSRVQAAKKPSDNDQKAKTFKLRG